jgi:hypothetical protein
VVADHQGGEHKAQLNGHRCPKIGHFRSCTNRPTSALQHFRLLSGALLPLAPHVDTCIGRAALTWCGPYLFYEFTP